MMQVSSRSRWTTNGRKLGVVVVVSSVVAVMVVEVGVMMVVFMLALTLMAH